AGDRARPWAGRGARAGVGAHGDRGAVMTVFCLVEPDGDAVADASLRALTLARRLAAGPAAGVACVIFDVLDPVIAAGLAAYGAGDVYVVSGIDGYAPQAWARVLTELLGPVLNSTALNSTVLSSTAGAAPEAAPHAVVAAGTERGNEVMAHLGAITGLPMAANCVEVSTPAADAGALKVVRQRWAGLLLEDASLDAPGALLTVATAAVAAEPAP